VRINQAIVHGQRAQAQVAERDRNEIQETLQGLHEALRQYIRESRHNGAPYGVTSNAAVVLQSVERVGLLSLPEIIISLQNLNRKSMPFNILALPIMIDLVR
jgi:hypothetical protein